MKIRSRHKDTTVEIYAGKRSFRSIQHELDVLRRQCGQSEDILTSTRVFLATTIRLNTFPIAVLLRREADFYGAVLLHGHKKYGIPTGMLMAGYLCGRGVAIAAAEEQPAVVEIATRALLGSMLAHTVVVSLLRDDIDSTTRRDVAAIEVGGRWVLRDTRSCISLDGGMDGLMSRLSYKMRRNLRYYRRRAEQDLSCVFIPKLSPDESLHAVEALHGTSLYPISTAISLRYEAALRDTPGSFAMGLQDGSGTWLSFLAGWRQAGVTYIVWQLNLMDCEAASLSTVMRSYCLEHEIGFGSKQIVFVGETTATWSRACVPQVCGDLLIVRSDIVGRLVRKMCQRLRPGGQIADILRRAAAGLPLEGPASGPAGSKAPTH